MNPEIEGVYLSEVTITDFPPFKGENKINFSLPDGRYQQWNVILGNNNTGKTTILRLLSGLSSDTRYYEEANHLVTGPNIFFHNEKFLLPIIDKKTQYVGAFIQVQKNDEIEQVRLLWWYKIDEKGLCQASGISQSEQSKHFHLFKTLNIYCYGLSRRMSPSNISETTQENSIAPLFRDNYELTNAEEWLIQLDYAAKNGAANAKAVLEKLVRVLTNGLLPDVRSIELISDFDEQTNNVHNYALFDTDYGKVRLKDLGYGYQSTMAWVVDLAKKMFERYPKLDNPLTGAAMVLVDEIDLHLHPDWQRKIISHLSGIFPNTQFIVTAHSPLIVQSAENVNLIILEKGENGQTHIRQEFGTFRGWTVEEILQDLMGLGDKTLSDTYLQLLKDFDQGLDEDNYDQAKAAYDALLPLLHPKSSQRKLLKLQLGAIAPATV